jgi:hypothetical protein
MLDRRSLTILWASMASYMDSSTFLLLQRRMHSDCSEVSCLKIHKTRSVLPAIQYKSQCYGEFKRRIWKLRIIQTGVMRRFCSRFYRLYTKATVSLEVTLLSTASVV